MAYRIYAKAPTPDHQPKKANTAPRTRPAQMDQLLSPLSGLGQISWAKLIYSAILLFVAGVLIFEVIRIWSVSLVYIGEFKYYLDAKPDEARAQTMRALILYHKRTLSDGFSRELERRRKLLAAANGQPVSSQPSGHLDGVYLPKGGMPISDSVSAFSNVELTVQGINFTQILTALRRTVSPPNEVTGMVGRMGDKVTAMVRWPRAPVRSDGLLAPSDTFAVEGARDDGELAFDIACSLIWIESVADTNSKLVGIDRTTFCTFARAWSDMAAIRARRSKHLPLSDADVTTLNLARQIVSGVIDQRLGFPEAHRLRAEIILLLPKPTEEDKAQRVGDLAAAEPETAPPPENPMELEAIISTQTRPALEVTKTRIAVTDAGMWAGELREDDAKVLSAAAAVGFLRGGRRTELPFSGTGFVVGRDMIATADYVIDFLAGTKRLGPLEGPAVEFVVADGVGSAASDSFRVTEILALLPGDAARPRMAILRVPRLEAAGHKPIKIAAPGDLPAGMKIGVLGFPSFDARVPQIILQQVFRNSFGEKRLMPGQIIEPTGGGGEGADLSHDAATIGGVGGGPIINLETGEVIGIHLGGTVIDTGKANFGTSMTTALPVSTRLQLGLQ
jgi:hypothetical protein